MPARKDHWGIEDELAGHYRRYDRSDFEVLLKNAGLKDVQVWSVAFPVANILFYVGNWFIKRNIKNKILSPTMNEKTELSGVNEIPYKTVFPFWCRILLNKYVMWPFLMLQKLFFKSNLGITLIGIGKNC